ncbi:hypothetical protein [Vibrio splendidus]|uniref:hypothetical protein n=1 Tax=Vibrio splendidus TaxID=29497 RepID=UPI000C866999|nr:hypothetical protein [Vibrio splendidus]PMK16018.1 hypothetical protein BCU08_00620 [Vibrio splendidus]
MRIPNEISEYLEELGDILEKNKFIKDTGPLRKSRTQFQKDPSKYSVTGLEFKTAVGEFVRGGVWDSELDIKMSADIEVTGDFEFSNASKMVVNIEYSCLDESGAKECKGCWHMDYHVMPGAPAYMHPDFHLHHGGRKINSLVDYGELVILDNPRVMHHPLDVFLAIDFIITNFYPEKEWKKLRADNRYKNIMFKAQTSWWKPYYEQLASYWSHHATAKKVGASKKVVDDAKKLNPQLLHL